MNQMKREAAPIKASVAGVKVESVAGRETWGVPAGPWGCQDGSPEGGTLGTITGCSVERALEERRQEAGDPGTVQTEAVCLEMNSSKQVQEMRDLGGEATGLIKAVGAQQGGPGASSPTFALACPSPDSSSPGSLPTSHPGLQWGLPSGCPGCFFLF